MQSHAINVCLLSSWSTPCSVVLTVVMFEKKSPLKRLNIMFVTRGAHMKILEHLS